MKSGVILLLEKGLRPRPKLLGLAGTRGAALDAYPLAGPPGPNIGSLKTGLLISCFPIIFPELGGEPIPDERGVPNLDACILSCSGSLFALLRL